jgi:hypothetical protein
MAFNRAVLGALSLTAGCLLINSLFTRNSKSVPEEKIAQTLTPFSPEAFYRKHLFGRQDKEERHVVHLYEAGLELVRQYYSNKYQTDILLVEYNFVAISKPDTLIRSLQHNSRGDFRRALILGVNSGHGVPLIYLEEEGEKGILYADSLPDEDNEQTLKDLAKQMNVPVYPLDSSLQNDGHSCYTHAVTLARDATAIDPETKQYKILRLLAKIKERSVKQGDNFYLPKLPDELLKTPQSQAFFKYHTENSSRKVHKQETIAEFRQRYEKNNKPDYLRQKGLKLAKIIEIQFYLNQLKTILGSDLTEDTRKQFVRDAKQFIKSNTRNTLFSFVVLFIKKIQSGENTIPRSGLRV